MLDCTLDKENAIVVVRPDSPLDRSDFVELGKLVDPQIEAEGDLAGLIIDAPTFPGWDSFGALVTHIRFVHDHHKHVKKVAVVTDSRLGDFAEHLAAHFVSAEIRKFSAGDVGEAQRWITGEA